MRMNPNAINLSRLIPPRFSSRFPRGYVNNVAGWGIPSESLHGELPDGTKKLLTLDLDFGDTCRLSCPHCFRKSSLLDSGNAAPLSLDEYREILSAAKDLGLESVKVLGAGEPFEEPLILELLQLLSELHVQPAVFTKGHVLGSDALASRTFSHRGISTAEELVSRLRDLQVSILLGFNSFSHDEQDRFVGRQGHTMDGQRYSSLRDAALVRLFQAGFSDYREGQPTHLALINAPLTPRTLSEAFSIYEWGRLRNIYTLACPTTYSGLGRAELHREKMNHDFQAYISDLEDLYVKIYIWNIETGLMTRTAFELEGVSLYPGCHPCNQVAAGMYISRRGKIVRCPGRDDDQWVIATDVRESALRDIWCGSENYRLACLGKYNYHCIARDGILFDSPASFYDSIKERVLDATSTISTNTTVRDND